MPSLTTDGVRVNLDWSNESEAAPDDGTGSQHPCRCIAAASTGPEGRRLGSGRVGPACRRPCGGQGRERRTTPVSWTRMRPGVAGGTRITARAGSAPRIPWPANALPAPFLTPVPASSIHSAGGSGGPARLGLPQRPPHPPSAICPMRYPGPVQCHGRRLA